MQVCVERDQQAEKGVDVLSLLRSFSQVMILLSLDGMISVNLHALCYRVMAWRSGPGQSTLLTAL